MMARVIGKKAIKGINSILNFAVLTVIVLVSAFAVYALWDSKQVYNAADKSKYAIYKPTVENEGKSFMELQEINPEVFAWLSVYGTNIDYPMTQGKTNMKYVNTNAEGQYSLTGAIFLDTENSMDFSDFNSITYGHHMEKKTMFGEIGEFLDKNMFDTHRYGNLYYDGKEYGIEFFAFVHADAYDRTVFTPAVSQETRQDYLDNLLAKAIHIRDVGVTAEDRIILLSTCSASSTNGRDILVGRITDKVYMDPFLKDQTIVEKENTNTIDPGGTVIGIPWWVVALTVVITIRLIVLIAEVFRKTKRKQYDVN